MARPPRPRRAPLLVALGGDAMVPALAAATTHWHREGRRAMAEGAAQLLAMLGSDKALRALDALSAEHPHDALGAAVGAALEAEAQARGEAVDDLLDGCAPRFGLALDGAAELTDGRRRFRVTLVGWKPSLTDEVGRELHAPPKTTRPDARREAVIEAWRELSHELDPTRRRERRRAEDALVNQRAWEAATWTDRVASHPILSRVYEGLVWVTDAGESFTWSAADGARGPDGEAVALASVKTLRLAHPAVDAALLARWEGASLEPPFAQRERAVEPVEGVTSRFEGRVMRAHDDRHDRHAQPWDREGWRVGPIEDHRFNALTWRAGRGPVEAALAVGGMVRWSADAREATVGALTFHRASSGEAIDPRDAPPVFVSEAAASVARMLR
ncbi:MAG: DUF4132 domain-containing protein [Polyangiales bacterium]